MSNHLGENKLITTLVRLPRFARFLITLAMLAFTSLTWFFFSYLSLNQEINGENQKYQNYLEQKFILQKTVKNLDLEKVKNEILSKQLKNNLKDDGLLQSEMDFVLNSLNQNSLVCSEFEPLENLEDEFFREEYYQFRASGDFKNVVSFLTDLQNFGGSIKFKDVQFVRIGKDKISIVAKLGIVNFLRDDEQDT
jgi:Tfp pilus assembly protein PilO